MLNNNIEYWNESLKQEINKLKGKNSKNDEQNLLFLVFQYEICNTNKENNMTSQIESIEKIDKYITKWNEYYNNQDFTNMEKQFKKIEKELEQVIPLENVINKARVVENLHNLIKNNGKNFNLSTEEIELAKKLV